MSSIDSHQGQFYMEHFQDTDIMKVKGTLNCIYEAKCLQTGDACP